MIEISVKIEKDIPVDQIKEFEDKVVYYTASLTREYTKGTNAYPYRTGELAREEMSSQITGSNAEYNLLAGTNYAPYVWKMGKVNWTNKSTEPQWYYNVHRKHEKTINSSAIERVLKEIK